MNTISSLGINMKVEYKATAGHFCRAMVRESDSGTIYRKEDIEQMSNDEVNKGWGPKGNSDNYDILKYKGGGNCYHLWRRQTFVTLNINDEPLDPNSDLAIK